jgi:ring-1,2-phenylacetyl-CoA epoxidase subunit PaaE
VTATTADSGGRPAGTPASAETSAARRQFRELTVARVDRLCDDAVAVTFAVPAEIAADYAFRPGQSLTLRKIIDGREERRSYSICASAGEPLRIGVREVPGGAVSGWLVREVRPGDRVEVQPPSGSFTADLRVPGRHVLIAAGSGITPVLSITASALQNPGAEATVLYGNRRADSVMFADEIADLKDSHPVRLQLAHVLSREPQEVELFSGRLDAARLRRLLPALCAVDSIDHWWLCGPYGLVTDAIEVLGELGVPAARIHRELFYVEEAPPDQERHEEPPLTTGCEATVILDGRTSTVTIPPGTPVLDGAQRARPDLPFACKGGVCGTCRALLRSGEVRMRRNFALEQSELDAGFVLTCQSLPVSEQLTVDYDA